MLRTLIIEDNALFRQSLKDVLWARFPFIAVQEAADGAEALQKVDAFAPNLIFMDIGLPGESGIALTKKIKESHSNTIIIVLTNYDLPEYRDSAYKAGADSFLIKGATGPERLLTLVDSILPFVGVSRWILP